MGRLPDLVTQRSWTHQPVVRERDRHVSRWLWSVTFGAGLALAPVGAYLLHQAEYVQLAYRVNELRTSNDRLAAEERQLQAELAQAESLGRLGKWADAHGLVVPDPTTVHVVSARAGEKVDLLARTEELDAPAGPTEPDASGRIESR